MCAELTSLSGETFPAGHLSPSRCLLKRATKALTLAQHAQLSYSLQAPRTFQRVRTYLCKLFFRRSLECVLAGLEAGGAGGAGGAARARHRPGGSPTLPSPSPYGR